MPSIGGNKSPFRQPCGGSTEKFYLGSPYQHQRATDAPVDAYGNTTTMLDHCGNTVRAKPRLYLQDTCGDAVCSGADCNACPGGYDLTTNTPEPPAVAANTWAKNGTVQLIPVRKIGGKWIQAFKAWHGRFGFLHNTDGTGCSDPTLSNIKYRTITITGLVVRSYDPDSDEEWFTEYTGNATISVNKSSGVITVTGCTLAQQTNYFGTIITDPESDLNLALPDVLGQMEYGCTTPDFYTTAVNAINGNGGPGAGAGQGTYSLAVTGTHYEIHVTALTFASNGSGGYYKELQVDCTLDLSDPYTIEDVYTDAKNLAALWNIIDDAQHPFRTDERTTIGPLVINNENTATAPPIKVTCDYTDPNAATYDGSVIGAPLAPGYGQPIDGNPFGIFNRDHNNRYRRNCDTEAGFEWLNAAESIGQFTPGYLPSNAPKWTDDFVATTLFPCAFLHADVSGIYLQKWSETQIRRPSINFARPYGPDKFVLDETAVYFMSDNTAGVVTLKNLDFTDPSSLPFTGADIVGGASIGGFYYVASVGTNTITLGAKVYDVPDGWNTPSGDGAKCLGKLRWPNAPGMDFLDQSLEVGGRVAVAVTNGSPVKLTTATTQAYLSITTAEQIDICDATMRVLAGGVAATRVDSNNFTVPSAFIDIQNAKWIVPAGTKYKFGDNRSKRDYVFRECLVTLADSSILSQSQTDACLQFTPCGPSIAVVTPNGETPPGGEKWDFPSSINNGELWLGQIQFWMIDPFYQVPHLPCATGDVDALTFDPDAGDTIQWQRDNGTCQEDYVETGDSGTIFHKFYPMEAFVEARCTLPVIDGDTPPPPAGVDLTVPASAPPQASLFDNEGLLVDAIHLPETAWGDYLRQQTCVNVPGRFATNYESNATDPSTP
jgi:hypothetical protein